MYMYMYVACGMLHVAILSFFRQCPKRKQQKLIVLEPAHSTILFGEFETEEGRGGAAAARGLIITHKRFDCEFSNTLKTY